MIRDVISQVVEGEDLDRQEMNDAIGCIMDGSASPAQIGGFLAALRMKGETADEITGCVNAMSERAVKISPKVDYCIDTCGTGGDGANTFNISTAAAIVAAAGGVHVAKHGNRSASGRCGSADVLEALGVEIGLPPARVEECIEHVGIGFLFAPRFHTSMKHAAGPRKELGFRSIFNIVGPLTNPAGAKGQLIGVFDAGTAEKMINVLKQLGSDRAMVIHGMDGMDELTVTSPTMVYELDKGEIRKYDVSPHDFGLEPSPGESLAGGGADTNAGIIRALFGGERGPRRDVLLLNAAAALYIGGKAGSLRQGLGMADEIIDSGLAAKKLDEFICFTKRGSESHVSAKNS